MFKHFVFFANAMCQYANFVMYCLLCWKSSVYPLLLGTIIINQGGNETELAFRCGVAKLDVYIYILMPSILKY